MELNKELFTRIENDTDSVIKEIQSLSLKDKVVTLFYLIDNKDSDPTDLLKNKPNSDILREADIFNSKVFDVLKANKDSLRVAKEINKRLVKFIEKLRFTKHTTNPHIYTEKLVNEFFDPKYDGLSNEQRFVELDTFVDNSLDEMLKTTKNE